MEERDILVPEKRQSPVSFLHALTPSSKLFFATLILALVKLWLISGEEIVARNQPHDDLWYLHSAKEWYWFGSYTDAPFGTLPFIRPPAYPLFIALAKLTGIPLRISIELLFLFAAFVFVWSIVKAGQSWLVGLLLFMAIVFHPATFAVYNLALTTALYAPMLLLALACMIMLLLRRDHPHRLGWALLTGIVLAVFWHVRAEGFVILAMLGVYGLIILATMGARRKQRIAALKQLGVTVLVPLLVVLIASFAIKTINYSKFGVFALDATSAPGFEAAHRALLRIKPMPPIRFVTLPREVRLRAYQVSPAFRELESYMEGAPGRSWGGGAKASGVEVEGEIGSGHSMWALNAGAYYVGHNKSAGETDRYFQRVADELNAACDDGRLQCRRTFTSFLDPHVQNYLRFLPESFGRVTALFFQKYEFVRIQDDEISSQVRLIFDEMAIRRRALSTPDAITALQGWAFAPNDSLLKIAVRDQAGKVLASTDQLHPRPDVVSAFGKDIKVPLNSGFRLEYPSTSARHAEIVFITQSGKEWVVPHTQKFHGVGGSPPSVTYGIDIDETFTKSTATQLRLQNFIGSSYGSLTTGLTYLGLCSLLVLVVCYRFLDPKENIYPIIALVSATVALRVFLFTLVDAATFRAAYDFYLLPVLYLYTCVILLLIAQAGRVIATTLDRYGILRRIDFRKLYGKRKPAESS